MADEAKGRAGVAERSGRSLTWLWMILALVVVGGFLTWLGMASEPSSVAVTEGEETVEDGAGEDMDVPVVDKDSLGENKAMYEGRRIRVEEVEATTQLGPAIFWGELGDRTNQVPILVRLDSTVAEGWEMGDGALYDITGTVERMADSLAAAWGEQGEFTGEGEEMQATFTDYFIQASRVRPARSQSSSDDEDDGADAAESDG